MVVVGVSVVRVMVWCGPVRRVGRVVCGARSWWGVVVMELVGVALVLGHWEAGVGGGGGVLVLLVDPCSLALREWWSLCGVNWMVLVEGRGAAVRWRWRALGRVLLAVRAGALDVGRCGVAWPRSWLGHRALLAGALAGPLARLGLLGLVGVGGRWPPVSSLGDGALTR